MVNPRLAETPRLFETLLQKIQKSETQGNSQKRDFETHHKYRYEISRLNEKFPRPAVFQAPFPTPSSVIAACNQELVKHPGGEFVTSVKREGLIIMRYYYHTRRGSTTLFLYKNI